MLMYEIMLAIVWLCYFNVYVYFPYICRSSNISLINLEKKRHLDINMVTLNYD